jgi:glycosyltransferase involved in cell wall biosynthesis
LFLGNKSPGELADLYATADLLLAPHGGVTLVEAALAARPIVAYDFDWHSEFLEDGVMGFLAKFKDVEELARLSAKLLDDEPLRKRFGENARRRALEGYGRADSLRRERMIYEELLGRG